MIRNRNFYFVLLFLLLVLLFLLDIALGSARIPLNSVISILSGNSEKESWQYIILNFRLPKALTAILVGAGVAVAGLNMQTLFKNPLADTSILGIGHGASLGVALFVLASVLLPGILPHGLQYNNWGLILAATLGAGLVLICVSAIAASLNDLVSILIIGVMIGFVTGALVSILQFFSDPELIKSYLVWTFGSLAGVTWSQLSVMAPVVILGLLFTLFLPKSMNALLLGENYAASVGVKVSIIRNCLILVTSVLSGTITAFTGPIAFIGIAVPHAARLIFRTSDHRILIPATILCGAIIMTACDIISQLPGGQTVLPVNSVTSLIGAPLVVYIVIKSRKLKNAFQ